MEQRSNREYEKTSLVGGLFRTRTHFADLDTFTGWGLGGGDLIVLAGRQSTGKTTLALNIAANIALLENGHILVFSPQISRMELQLRMGSAKLGCEFLDPTQEGVEWSRVQRLSSAFEHFYSSRIIIDDTLDLEVQECAQKVRNFREELSQNNCMPGLIIFDCAEMVMDSEARNFGRREELGVIVRSLKQLARTVNVPILLTWQLPDSRWPKPRLSDLNDSEDALFQDSDLLLLLHREHASDRAAEVIIAKNRKGYIGSFPIVFRPECFRFENPVRLPVKEYSHDGDIPF